MSSEVQNVEWGSRGEEFWSKGRGWGCGGGGGGCTPPAPPPPPPPLDPALANFFFGRGFNLEIFLNLQGSEFIQTLLFIYNHLAKFVVYKSWTRSALLKGTSKCFLVSSMTCRSKEAIEWVWSFLCGKIGHKTTPITSSSLSQAMTLGRKNLLIA